MRRERELKEKERRHAEGGRGDKMRERIEGGRERIGQREKI